ncbi:MAG: MFS transporter [Actinomycetota bacterium]|nr:MFS transporter [Actinomycetota bacterium]
MSADMRQGKGLEQAGTTVGVSAGAYRRLARNPKFRRLWLSQFVSGTGDWLVIGFLMPLVTRLSGGSSFAVAGILIAKIIPALVFSSVIGVFVDRFDRRRTMIAADVVRSVLALGLIAVAGFSPGLQLALIYIVVLLMETASLFFFPAKNALIPYLVEDDDMPAANGLSYTTQQASMLVGLAASGAILAGFEAIVHAVMSLDIVLVDTLIEFFKPALLGPRAGVFLDSLTFLISAVAILGIRVRAKAPSEDGALDLSLVGKDVVESFRFLGQHGELRGFLVTIGMAILGGGTIIPVGLTFVQQELSGFGPFMGRSELLQSLAASPQTFMLVFLALGMVAGALVVPRLAGQLSLQLLFLGGVAGFGVAMFGFASSGTYGVAGIFAAVAGLFIATVTVAGNTYVICTVADEIRGRVFTALESVIRVSLLLSMIVMAPIGDFAAKIVRRIVELQEMNLSNVTVSGSQVALQLASLIVLAAAVYAFRTLNWRTAQEHADA